MPKFNGVDQKCWDCKIIKPLKDFNRCKVRKSKRQAICRSCAKVRTRARDKKHYIEHKDYHTKKNYFRGARDADIRRGMKTCSKEHFIEIMEIRTCYYCGLIKLSGVDRIDSSIGHIEGNIVPCCDYCNIAKSDHFSLEEMVTIGVAIRLVRKERKDPLISDEDLKELQKFDFRSL